MKLPFLFFVLLLIGMSGCKDDAPAQEASAKEITKVQLIFSDKAGGAPITVNAVDPDGAGPMPLETLPYELEAASEYDLFLKLENEITGEDLTRQIEGAADQHMVFFGFSEGLFVSPEGDGNIDARADRVNYLDRDAKQLPLGLITAWVTGDAGEKGTLRLMLKHQPNVKSETSSSSDGITDLDISWEVSLK